MIRASLGNQSYWDESINRFEGAIAADLLALKNPSLNPSYEPQFWFDHSKYALRIALSRYSRGDAVIEMKRYFEEILNGWELSNRRFEDLIQAGESQPHRGWVFELTNLNHYNFCFWLTGLALTLNISDDQWRRLLDLIGGAGQDELLDCVVATRESDRIVGAVLLHPKPYSRLLAVVRAPEHLRAELLSSFVKNWYLELSRNGSQQLWWYDYGDPIKNPLTMGSYFGRWCIEAAVVAKIFGIDDFLCCSNENYPSDLLRQAKPTVHIDIKNKTQHGFFRTLLSLKR